jgi:Centromere DNA-binding protein complex CBF3 subunit, domain 2
MRMERAFRSVLHSPLLVSFRFLIYLQVLAILADNAKHNQTGRTDEHGAIRHRHVELCPVAGVAMQLWATFHVRNFPVPDFEPDFSDPECGEYGRRDWYDHRLFFSSTGNPTELMQYKSKSFSRFPWPRAETLTNSTAHNDRVNLMHSRNDVSITKSTHAGRPFAAQTARAHGASASSTKALGGWSDSGSFRPCYDRAFPVDALLGAAMFNAYRPDSYCLPRDALGEFLLVSKMSFLSDHSTRATRRTPLFGLSLGRAGAGGTARASKKRTQVG